MSFFSRRSPAIASVDMALARTDWATCEQFETALRMAPATFFSKA